ncbi:platelet-activating factor receptor-like [Patiria miniata]|uniref:G-protein coupled receptors family 1 profile domain-containing protein n=1 Tax=Patiria miniata TaxID=46514 RepID=A0A913ZDF7_PATMI|nr:platelet-activating factor receptor-like [Patiria miniata]
MWSYDANVSIYAQATTSLAQLDILVCTFFTCVFQNNSDNCSVAYSFPQMDHPLIWDETGPSPWAPMNESFDVPSNERYELLNHSLRIVAFQNPAEADKFVYSSTQTVLFGFVLPVLKLLGILSILSFFFTLCRVPSMRNITNFYLTNLAVADLMVLISEATHEQCVALTTQTELDVSYLGNSAQAVLTLLSFTCNMGVISSIAFVTLLSYDRYFAICYPFQHRNLNLKRRAIRAAVCIWVLSFSINLIVFFDRFLALNVPPIKCLVWPTEEKYKHLSGNVQLFLNNDATLGTLNLVVHYVFFCVLMLSLILTVTFNMLLIKGLHAPNPTGDQIRGPSKHLQRVTLILGINTAVVFVCFLPQAITGLVGILVQSSEEVNVNEDVKWKLDLMTACLLIMNSSINSVIFNAGSGRYRKAFKQAFCCRKRQQVPTNNIPLQTLPRADPADRIRS